VKGGRKLTARHASRVLTAQVGPSTSFVARVHVPPIPPTFRPEQATVYYYLNLVMPDDGNSDVSNSTAGYGFMNQARRQPAQLTDPFTAPQLTARGCQFVPQLELGEALCGSTGVAGGYQTGPVSSLRACARI
jgi:hypothetical protein